MIQKGSNYGMYVSGSKCREVLSVSVYSLCHADEKRLGRDRASYI